MFKLELEKWLRGCIKRSICQAAIHIKHIKDKITQNYNGCTYLWILHLGKMFENILIWYIKVGLGGSYPIYPVFTFPAYYFLSLRFACHRHHLHQQPVAPLPDQRHHLFMSQLNDIHTIYLQENTHTYNETFSPQRYIKHHNYPSVVTHDRISKTIQSHTIKLCSLFPLFTQYLVLLHIHVHDWK